MRPGGKQKVGGVPAVAWGAFAPAVVVGVGVERGGIVGVAAERPLCRSVPVPVFGGVSEGRAVGLGGRKRGGGSGRRW